MIGRRRRVISSGMTCGPVEGCVARRVSRPHLEWKELDDPLTTILLLLRTTVNICLWLYTSLPHLHLPACLGN